MLSLRHHRHDAEPSAADPPVCAEYRASGLELRLIDLVEERTRAEVAGRVDTAELEAKIATVRDEQAAVCAEDDLASPVA